MVAQRPKLAGPVGGEGSDDCYGTQLWVAYEAW